MFVKAVKSVKILKQLKHIIIIFIFSENVFHLVITEFFTWIHVVLCIFFQNKIMHKSFLTKSKNKLPNNNYGLFDFINLFV